jgi:hypothetical protein
MSTITTIVLLTILAPVLIVGIFALLGLFVEDHISEGIGQ